LLDEDKSIEVTPETPHGATDSVSAPATKKAAARKTARKAPAKKAAAGSSGTAPASQPGGDPGADTPAEAATAQRPAKKAPAKKTAAKKAATKAAPKAAPKTAPKAAAKKTTAKKAAAPAQEPIEAVLPPTDEPTAETAADTAAASEVPPTMLLFQAPEKTTAPRRTRKPRVEPVVEPAVEPAVEPVAEETPEEPAEEELALDLTGDQAAEAEAEEGGEAEEGAEPGAPRRRRRRGGRRRRKPGEGGSDASDDTDEADETDESDESDEAGAGQAPEAGAESGEGADDEAGEGGSRRRRRRRRAGESAGEAEDDPSNTVTRVRQTRTPNDQITAVSGSTRLEAKKQRRREGREAGRRRAPIVSEAEFLARRESVERVMVIRQKQDLTQIAVLEDKVLVEHYVARESQTSLIGNVYVGRVQNVLPSMEAAFVDIGKGRNAVLYAGEVNWSALGHKDGQPRKIESVLSSGQSVLVQVTKDPIGHKGARLTSQVSLAGRFLVYVPDGTTSGISRKLPDTERNRLKTLLKEIVPDTAGVIVRTAAEGASEDELTHDVERLKARWDEIEKQAKSGNGPKLLYGEPDLTLKVVRDLFTEDFTKLVIEGDDAWDTVRGYVTQVAPDLESRLQRYERDERGGDIFATYRIDEQIAKGIDRKVWLPSGGSLIIDRTEAMTVVDVNTGKFTGSGGNLEETVTRNNLEAAEEIVRQLRLRDIGGIIVVDFIDMVLESNRDLVLRRLVECLGRDRTRHQVAEVTSLGLVQMTRKRIGTGLLEAFSETCEHCGGRGLTVHDMPVEPRRAPEEARGARRSRGRGAGNGQPAAKPVVPSPADIAAHHPTAPVDGVESAEVDEVGEVATEPEQVETVETEVVLTAELELETSEDEAPEDRTEPVTEPALASGDGSGPDGAAEDVTDVVPEPPEAAPAEPAAPKVITRTRKAASRPAGSASTTAAPIVIVPAEPVSVPATPVEPPKVVTRTRGRSASRAAGPAAGTADDHAEAHPDLHVPIKKKGARKH